MSYMRSSYKASSYRYSSTNEGSSRLRSSTDNDYSISSPLTTRRTSNYGEGTSYSTTLSDEYGTNRRSSRLGSSHFSTDSDFDIDSSIRYTSKYKISHVSSDEDDFSTSRKYSRFNSRDENDNISSTSRTIRYSSFESGADDDLGSSSIHSSSVRRRTKLSYLSEEDDNKLSSSSKSFRTSLSYDVTTPVDEDVKTFSSYTETASDKRRYQGNSSTRSLSRLDSKDSNQVYEVILDYTPPRSAIDEISLKEGQEVIVLSKDKPHKWKVRTRKSKNFRMVEEGFAPSAYLKPTNERIESDIVPASGDAEQQPKHDQLKDLNKKKDMIVRELIETEEDLIRDMQFVLRTYIRQSESSITPREIKSTKEDIFHCFKELLEFHKDVLLKNFQTLAKEPAKIGTLFLKIQSDFSNHSKYCQNLPKALEILDENPDVSEYFNNYSVKIRDEKPLSEHLKLPLQRLNDYQLLLKELSKNLSRLNEDVSDLEKAIKFVATIPENKIDDQDEESESLAMKKLEPQPSGFEIKSTDFNLPTGSTEKLSNLLKNVLQAKDFFDVVESDGTTKERFIFFFKSRMFITEINKTLSADQRTYNVEKIIKLPEVEICDEDSNTLIIKSKDNTDSSFPIRLRCQDENRIQSWLKIINSLPKLEEDSEEIRMKSFSQQTQKPLGKLDENNNNINQPIDELNISNDINKIVTPHLDQSDSTIEEKTQAKKIVPLNSGKDLVLEETNVDEKYRIINDLKSVTKHVGDSAIFQCQVSPGTVNVQWLKDNEILSGLNYKTYKKDDIYFLELKDLSLDQSGIYTFIASNSKRSVASSSTLNVLSDDSRPTSPGGSFLPHPPKFKVKLKDTELLEGTTVRFELIVRGLPIPSVKIFKDGKILKEDDHLQIIFQSKEVFEIIIQHVNKNDAGVYKCIATNPEGEAETSGRITITKNKDVFFGLEDDSTSIERMANMSRCGSPTFKWFKDGKEFEASERFQVQYDDQEDTVALIFQHVTPEDAGLYTCVAATSSGKISCNAELNVQGVVNELPREPIAPKFLKELSNVDICKGQSVAILEAQICGFPKPAITWYKENKKLEASDHYKMLTEGEEKFTLVIKDVTDDDVGHYKLQAANKLGLAESSAQLIIVKKPEFKITQNKIEVSNNEQLIIEQTYEAVPEPTIKWQKDGKDLNESNRIKTSIEPEKHTIKLIIDKATSEDTGNYVCMITNNLGSASQSTKVSVNAPPKFLKKFEAIEIFEHETAIFSGQYFKVPNVKLEFYKENQLIKTDNRIGIEEEKDGKFSLIIKDCNIDDEGKYRCRIKNDYGYDEDEASLVVKKQQSVPEFKEQLKNMEVYINDENVQLVTKVEGEPRPICKWFHDGQPIMQSNELYKIVDEENTSTLIIPKVLHEHQGTYVCKSENNNGKAETSADLIVNCPPYIIKPLENVESSLGMDVELTAVIKGYPKPAIKWFCNNEEIKISDRKNYSYDEANAQYTLFIKKFQNEDVGEYKIEAQNSYGKCVSSSKVQIASKPLFSKVLKNIAVKEMESNIEMVVKLVEKNSQPLIKWFKDDQEIKDDNNNYKKVEDKIDRSYKLIILKASEEMIGKYKCVAANEFGSTETSARFDITSKPRFIQGLHDLDVIEGNNVSMTVKLAGFPKPEVTFYKNGEEISTEAKIQIKKEMDDIYQLEIENIRIIMSGEYECRIKNEAGEASSKGIITVCSKPQIIKDLTDQTVNIGEDVVLEVVVTGKPSPKIKWFVNGQETPGNERILFDSREESYSMKIPNAQESDSAIYHCIVSNQFGEQSSEKSNVKVITNETVPQFTKKFTDATVVVDDNVRFDTTVFAIPKAEIFWSKDSVPFKPSDNVQIKSEGDNHTLILRNLQLSDSGVITCKAQNSKGFTTQTANLNVEEPTLPTISGLDDKKVIDGEPLKIEAIVMGFPKPIVEWSKDNQPVDIDSIYSEPQNDQYGIDFKILTSDLAGTYTCSAMNCAGKVEKSFNIEICGKKPTFIKELEETEIVMSVDKQNNRLKLGQSAIFETIVDGFPTPEVKWLKNDQELRPSDRVFINNVDNEHKLEIKTITKDDVAKYTCKATNQFGEALSVCLLKFLNEPHEPIIKKPLENVKIEKGDDLTLFCKVDGEPMPAVRWLKDNEPLENDNRVQLTSKKDGSTTLIIEKTQLADSGIYQVEAENAKGIASSTAKVLVVEPQRPPTFQSPLKEQIKIDCNNSLILEAIVFGLPQPNVEWLKDGKVLTKNPRIKISENENGLCQLKIDKVNSEDAGRYSLKASNDNGQVVTSSDVKVMPEPYAPLIVENLPIKVQVTVGEPIRIHSKIEAYPAPKIIWLKENKPLLENDRVKIINDDDGTTCLTIQSAVSQDQGAYMLKAENLVGEISSSTKVQVLTPEEEKPMNLKDKSLNQATKSGEEIQIEKSMPNQKNIAYGENLQLNMKLTSKPLSIDDVRIYKDDLLLKQADTEKNLKILDSGEVQFLQQQCLPSDSGLYRIEIITPNRSLSSSCLVNVLEPEKPIEKKLKFKKELDQVEVESGLPCRLECMVDGDLNGINISWYKDDEELMPNEHYGFVKEPNGIIALLIDSFSAKDVGMYKVKISSNQEEISSSNKALLRSNSKNIKPMIVEGLQDTTGKEGSLLCLKSQISATVEPITCRWFYNDKELKESDSIKFLNFPDGTIMLQMKDIRPSDSGKYKVIISNQFGESFSEAKVIIKSKEHKPPTLLKSLEPKTLIAGQPGFIEFQVDSTDGDIKFLLGSQHIIPDDRIHVQQLPNGCIRLNFDNVTLSDAGNYTAIFKNEGGFIQSNGLVTVQAKPIVIKPLSDLSVKEKCSTKFEVQIEANPEPEITWAKNGSDLQIDQKHFTTLKSADNIYCLVINDCVARDKGEYSVKATNELGSAYSKAKLNIIFGSEFEECSPIFLENLCDMAVRKGDNVVLKTKIKAHPVPEVLWKKNNQKIQMNPDKIFSNFNGEDLQLTILDFGDNDIGTYEAYIENELGQTSSSAKITEIEGSKPKFIKILTDMKANFKTPIKLSCKVEGYPEPKIKWLFNGEPIESGLKYNIGKEFGQETLTIFDPFESDSGVYECVAENDFGTEKTMSNVLFMEKDKDPVQFVKKLQDYDVLPGATARFTACVIGNPKPEIKWFKDEKEIKIDDEKYYFLFNENGMITFEIRDVCQEDLGKYRCFATNKFGCDNSIGQLNFETVDGLDRMNQSHKSMKSQQRIYDTDEITFQTSGLPKPLNEKPIITKMIDNSLTLLWLPSIPEQPRFPVSYVVEFCKISDGIWVVYHGNIKDIKCDVIGLEPFEDYGFRVRVENKFGISDPSPSVMAFRSQLKDDKVDYKKSKPDDFDLKHAPPEKIAAAPVFVREEESSMYGIVGQPVTIEFWLYGYPEPDVTWLFENQKIENQERFKYLKDRNGRTCLFISKMKEEDVGYFTCLAQNEHGTEKKSIKLMKAEPPKFTKILEETNILSRNHIRLNCSVIGTPEPTIKWFKDFQPLHDTSRIKLITESPDSTILVISDAMARDSGLYSCTATNIAGSTTTSAFVHVKEQEINYEKYPFSYKDAIKPKNKMIEQFYDVGDELGRGTQGITYHVVERSTGKSYAAKMMHGTGEMRQYMNSELDIMNQLGSHEKLTKLHDCFASTPYSMSLIMGLNGGGTLMEHVLKKGTITEQEVADYIKQILEGLHYMHYKNIGHFGLTINDILMERINSSDITICDFGLANRLIPGASHYVEFGQPEFVSPEIVDKNSVTFTTDVWSVGIITHILLTGISPFYGENDRTTLQNIQNKKIDLSDEKLIHISEKGRDFLRKTLNFNPHERLDVKAALNHPWIKTGIPSEDKSNLNIMNNLRNYKSDLDKWYQNASCKRYYRRRPLHSCYTHPSRMIYPPDEQYSPLISPEREMKKFTRNVAPFENIYPPNQTIGSESFTSDSHYQCGPDTYLLQLRDTDFPARIRRYLRIAAVNSPSIASNLKQAHWGRNSAGALSGNFSQVSIKERRKFTDIMDEEINEELKGFSSGKPRRLAREVGTPLYLHGQWKALKKETGIMKDESKDDSDFTMPFFREKLKDTFYIPGENVVLTCHAVGIPTPTYTWFRNDSILIETNRTKVKRMENGCCQLILEPSKEYDIGVYKCVARNTIGSVICRARLSIGDVPGTLYPPFIKDFSSHDVLLVWSTPRPLGDSSIKYYKLEFKKIENTEWLAVDANIKQEFYLVTDLEPNQSYHFRLSVSNKFGWSQPSIQSETVKMLAFENNKTIALSPALQYVCNEIVDEETTKMDYNIENVPIPLIKSEFKELYDFKSIIAMGKFSVVTRAYVKDGNRRTLACKCVLSQSEHESSINNEYEICKSLAHEKIVRLFYANRDSNLFTLAMEMLSGLNILTYLGRKQFYSEQCVCTVICQVFDAIEYLHFRGIGLLELQPDNILIVDERNLQIKLTDFANSRYIKNNCSKVNIVANPEYIAPELIRNDEVTLPYTDIWTVGVLTYILLSGHSPFKGNDSKETAQNVVFVRYLFERLYPKVTQEAIRFLLSVFKLTAHKRPTIEECFESKWLLPNEFMMKKREAAIFDSNQINSFAKEFFTEKSSVHSRLFDLIGLKE